MLWGAAGSCQYFDCESIFREIEQSLLMTPCRAWCLIATTVRVLFLYLHGTHLQDISVCLCTDTYVKHRTFVI